MLGPECSVSAKVGALFYRMRRKWSRDSDCTFALSTEESWQTTFSQAYVIVHIWRSEAIYKLLGLICNIFPEEETSCTDSGCL